MNDQDRIDEKKEKYELGYHVDPIFNIWTKIVRIVKQTVRRISDEILGVKV